MLSLLHTSAEYTFRSKCLQHGPKDLGIFLRKRLPTLGPTYTKFGQWISSRPDVFGSDMCKELTGLQDRVPPMPYYEVQEAIKGTSFHAQALDVEVEPMASASIAQVHRAKLRDGMTVAVKIARTGVLQSIETDIDILDSFLKVLNAFNNEGVSETRTLLAQFKERLLTETDFGKEAAELMRFRTMYAHNPVIRVPQVYPELCSSRLLVMEYIPSTKLDDIPDDDRNHVAMLLMTSFLLQVMQGGLVHADPHAGNLGMHAVTKQIVLYDFGNVIELSPELIKALKQVMLNIMDRNVDEIIDLFPKLGITVLQSENLRGYVNSYIDYIESLDPEQLLNNTAFTAPPPKGGKVPLTVNVQLLSLLRIFSMLEGICKALDPSFNYMTVWPFVLLQISTDSDIVADRIRRDLMKLFNPF